MASENILESFKVYFDVSNMLLSLLDFPQG